MRDQYVSNQRLTPQVTTAAEVANAPTLWAIPGLLPTHHLSAILAPTGTGLTQLAIQICAHLAPKPPLPQLPDHQPSDSEISDSQIPDLQSKIQNPQSEIPLSPPPLVSPSCDSSPCPSVPASPCPSDLLSPSSDPPPSVLFVGGREYPETLRARLIAAGADLRRILFLTGVTDGAWGDQIRRPVCGDNYDIISDLLHQHKGIRLVIIDNAEDLFCDSNRTKRNRLLRQLACFRQVAEKREANICLLANVPQLDAHPCRTTFLSCLREVCRAVHLLTPDLPNAAPVSESSALRSPLSDLPTRLLITIKNTLATTCPTLRLNLFPSGEAGPNPSSIFTLPSSLFAPALTYPQYLIAARTSAQRRGPKPVKLDFACQVLLHLLQRGPLLVGNYKKPMLGTLAKLTEEAGVAWNTAQRAMLTLNITAFQHKNRWYWQLPDTIPQAEPTPASALSPSVHPSSFSLHPSAETSLSEPPNAAQPQQNQDDTQGRATPENRADLSNVGPDEAPSNERRPASVIGFPKTEFPQRLEERDTPSDNDKAMDSVADPVFVTQTGSHQCQAA